MIKGNGVDLNDEFAFLHLALRLIPSFLYPITSLHIQCKFNSVPLAMCMENMTRTFFKITKIYQILVVQSRFIYTLTGIGNQKDFVSFIKADLSVKTGLLSCICYFHSITTIAAGSST